MKYQVNLYGNQSILLTDEQYKRILQAWDLGAEEFSINEQRIPRKAISHLGYTPGASEQSRIEESEMMRSLPQDEQKELSEARYLLAHKNATARQNTMLEATRERVWKSLGGKPITIGIEEAKISQLPMSEKESERGDSDFWVDEDGVKHYD